MRVAGSAHAIAHALADGLIAGHVLVPLPAFGEPLPARGDGLGLQHGEATPASSTSSTARKVGNPTAIMPRRSIAEAHDGAPGRTCARAIPRRPNNGTGPSLSVAAAAIAASVTIA